MISSTRYLSDLNCGINYHEFYNSTLTPSERLTILQKHKEDLMYLIGTAISDSLKEGLRFNLSLANNAEKSIKEELS
jgi:hypothetical protein